MKAGELNHLVTIQQPVRLDDGQAGHTTTWADWRQVWAKIQPTSGNRRYEAAQVVQGVSHVITTYWLDGYSSTARIVHGTRTFYVKGVTNIGEAGEQLDWMCEERTA